MTNPPPPPSADPPERALPELLAPAGHWEALRAAAANGADAIYFGVEAFNARMRAANFQRSELPELVLMDVVMPGLNGFQATRQLTKGADTAHIPIVIVTTKDQETDRVWGKRQGARDYLTKPVDEDVLLQTVDRLLADS